MKLWENIKPLLEHRVLLQVKKYFVGTFNEFSHAWGFDSWTSMWTQLLMFRDTAFTGKVFMLSLCAGIFIWLEEWVFAPLHVLIVFTGMTVAESIFGAIKSQMVEKEKFHLDKFIRVIPKIIAHTFALSAAWHMSKADPLFSWMPSTVFIFFTSQNFLKTILHLVALGWMDGNFARFIQDKFTDSKYFKNDKQDH